MQVLKKLTHCLCCRWPLGKCKQRAQGCEATAGPHASTLQQYDSRIEQLEDSMLKARTANVAALGLLASWLFFQCGDEA
jgi:hypothetical protein